MAKNHTDEHLWMILGSIVGGMIGAAAALLFAPKSGTELREDIASRFSDRFQAVPLSKKGRVKAKKVSHKRSSPKKTALRPKKPAG